MSSGLRLLYVDDDDLVRDLVRLSLNRDPYLQSQIVNSGEQALACLETFAPDVVLLDVSMPEMDGSEVLRRLRLVPGHSHTPVIFMTARALADERQRLMALGAVGVIIKPFDPISLAGDIRAMVGTSPGG
ncbi:response regulator [Phenylobacterium sp.]|uniref:response regulator n=1 Tax=Phenylobacterium sp. TaxID=1871053 RepID=UPI0027255272|nr:response regulator [Phenylobacterium sp.]MDO8801552.1 response regulator [Phenylobacterium sp.]